MIVTAKQISEMLAQRADAVSQYLFPNGKKMGNEFCVGSLQGEKGESLKIHLTGEKAGVWSDFQTGDAGDLLNLWQLKNNCSVFTAMKEAKTWLGISQTEFYPKQVETYDRPIDRNFVVAEKNEIVLNYLQSTRKLKLEILRKFKICANEKNEIVFPFLRDSELINLKYLAVERIEGKKNIRAAKNCEPILFGWQAVNPDARKIVLCEGEMDCLSLHQYGFDALSIPFGAGKGNKQKWLEIEFNRLAIFDEIYLCFDNDEPGYETVQELLPRLGQHRCRIVKLPYKDANECLQKNVSSEEIQKYFEESISVDPKELKPFHYFFDKVYEKLFSPEKKDEGIHSPWNRAKDKILFRPHELSLWTGISGHGKSLALTQIALSAMEQSQLICIASMELHPELTLKRMILQAAALGNPSEDYFYAICEWFKNKGWLFDVVGSAKADQLLDVFLYAHQRYGINFFVIDSLLKCGIAEDDYNKQKLFVEKLCDFKNQYSCQIHLIAHPRKSEDETNVPGKFDIRGTAAITDLADNCFTIWRNKKKQEEIELVKNCNGTPSHELLAKPDATLTCTKQRNGDWEGIIPLWFNKESGQFLNNFSDRAKPYVQFSKRVI